MEKLEKRKARLVTSKSLSSSLLMERDSKDSLVTSASMTEHGSLDLENRKPIYANFSSIINENEET
jgi:hypothetical protein